MLITLFHDGFKGQYFLWTPVFFSIGIILYFSLSFEPSGELFKFVPLTALGLGLLLFVRQPNQKYLQIGLSLMIFSGGFLFAQFETFRADSPFLKYPITTDIDAVIEWQEKRVNSSLFILKVLKADKIHPRYRPHRVRVYGKQVFLENTQPGCEVSVRLQLRPSEFTIWPDGYEPRFVAHFRQEGAVGFIREFQSINCEPLDDSSRAAPYSERFSFWLSQKGLALSDRITSSMSQSAGGIAAALITGVRGQIKPADRETLRYTGLAHMLAISGMHMAMFAGTIYALLGLLFAFIPALVQSHNTRIIRVVIAWSFGLFYLFISGGMVATQRAFIMMSLVFLAIILGRVALTMRNVALAAIAVLFIAPQSVMQASFQMSFSAVVALVAFYEVYGRGRLMTWPKRRIGVVEKNLRLVWLYFIALFMTSIIAGLTTGYVGIIHFNLIGVYGLLANLLAMPILGVVIMPAAMVALIAMPFGMEKIPLMVMQWGIEQALLAANWCLTFPAPVTYIAASPKLALPLFGIALVWLCLVKSKLRHLAWPVLLVVSIMMGQGKKLDLIINVNASHVAARQLDGSLMMISKTKNSFVPSRWLLSDGVDRKAKEVQRVCVKAACYLPIKDKRLAVVYKSSAIAEACAKADMVILATENKNPITCPFVFHRKMSKPGETLFYEFKTGNDMPVHYAGGLKTKKRIWLN